jgi:class 3 adenylate cyclase
MMESADSRSFWSQFWRNISYNGIDKNKMSEEQIQHIMLVNRLTPIISLLLLLSLLIHLYNQHLPSIVLVLSLLGTIWLGFWLIRKGYSLFARLFLSFGAYTFAMMICAFSSTNTSEQILLSRIFLLSFFPLPFVIFSFEEIKIVLILTLYGFLGIVFFPFFNHYLHSLSSAHLDNELITFVIFLLLISAVVAAVIYYKFLNYLSDQKIQKQNFILTEQKQEIERKNEQLAQEQEKTERLLLNILPKEVAEELKETGSTEVRYFEKASILFADVKGFSALAKIVSPQELIKELNFCFTKFDEIIEKYSLERIKTIGDCYMAAGGVPSPNRSNALDIVMAALEIQNWMENERKEREKKGGTYWQVRLGIHTGDLVSGVIGISRFAYDVWGNTVNLAARLETGGEVGRVHISESTFQDIQGFFDFEAREPIEAKNIGWVNTYFVQQLKEVYQDAQNTAQPNSQFFADRKAWLAKHKPE